MKDIFFVKLCETSIILQKLKLLENGVFIILFYVQHSNIVSTVNFANQVILQILQTKKRNYSFSWTMPFDFLLFCEFPEPGKYCKFSWFLFPGQPNFGAIQVDWNSIPQRLKIELRDLNGESVAGVDFLLSELQLGNKHMTSKRGWGYQHHCSVETDLPWILRYCLAFLFFGAVTGMQLISCLYILLIWWY